MGKVIDARDGACCGERQPRLAVEFERTELEGEGRARKRAATAGAGRAVANASDATTRPWAEPDLAKRFVLEVFAKEGVLVDLASGGIYRLDEAASTLCCPLTGTSTNEGLGTAAHDLLGSLAPEPLEPTIVGPFLYQQHDAGYLLHHLGAPVIWVDAQRRAVRLVPDLRVCQAQIVDYLDGVAPKLLSLVGLNVMHAAVVRRDGRLIMVSGKSGSGKTTSARCLAKEASDVVSVDVAVLSLDGPILGAFVGAEAAKDAWIASAAEQLAKERDKSVSFEPLASVAAGRVEPIAELWFLDAARRHGAEAEFWPLQEIDAFLACIGNSFLGSGTPEALRRLVRTCRVLSRGRCLDATMPDGLEKLAADLAHYKLT